MFLTEYTIPTIVEATPKSPKIYIKRVLVLLKNKPPVKNVYTLFKKVTNSDDDSVTFAIASTDITEIKRHVTSINTKKNKL